MKRIQYFENLDGLRFLCFLSVLFLHSFHTDYPELRSTPLYQFVKTDVFGNGNIGVNFFFVLSGFLITYLLILEKNLNTSIDLGKFWMRRVLRIWPLFYLCVFFGFFIFPFLKEQFGQQPDETAGLFWYLTFLNNFDFIAKGPPDASVLGVLWSIAIEEQFYLLWPLILAIVPFKRLWIPFLLIFLMSLGFRAYHDSETLNEYHTLSCISDMAMGATGAWLVVLSPSFKQKITDLSIPLILLIYFSFFGFYFYREDILNLGPFSRTFERPVLAVIILLIILEQNYSKNSIFKLGRFTTLSRLGRSLTDCIVHILSAF